MQDALVLDYQVLYLCQVLLSFVIRLPPVSVRNLRDTVSGTHPNWYVQDQLNGPIVYFLIMFFYAALYKHGGLCGLTVERSLAIQKVVGLNLGRSASR